MRLPNFTLRSLLLLPLCIASLLAIAANLSHQQTVLGNERYKAFYRGLGWSDGGGAFGRRYYLFTIDDSPYRHWRIRYEGGEYGDAVCRYPDGTIALEGDCRIEVTKDQAFPLVDMLRNAKSYSPGGQLVATVRNGSGHAILFYPDGTLNWEIHYEAGKRKLMLEYTEDGILRDRIANPEDG